MKVKDALQLLATLGFVSTAAFSEHHEGGKHMEKAMKNDKVKCYGVAKAGKNDCGNKSGTHSCAGLAKKDYDKGEWKYAKSRKKCTQMQAMVVKKKLDKVKTKG